MIHSALRATLLLVVVAAGCTAAASSPSPASSPTPGGALTTAELRYRLIETFGPLWFCDPDFYPVARADEDALAVERFGEVQADGDAFAAILEHLAIPSGVDFTADQKLAIYRALKQLNAIRLEPAGEGNYLFDYINMPAPGASEGRRTAGTLDERGAITIDQQAPAVELPCPICLARGTRIASPGGEIPIEVVRVGMRVWSVDETGGRMVANVVRIGQTRVPASHQVVRLVLDDGRIVHASPGHPLADGRLLATVQAGDQIAGATVVSATLEPYRGGSTFDLLTDSPSHLYVADGIPLRSTLAGH